MSEWPPGSVTRPWARHLFAFHLTSLHFSFELTIHLHPVIPQGLGLALNEGSLLTLKGAASPHFPFPKLEFLHILPTFPLNTTPDRVLNMEKFPNEAGVSVPRADMAGTDTAATLNATPYPVLTTDEFPNDAGTSVPPADKAGIGSSNCTETPKMVKVYYCCRVALLSRVMEYNLLTLK